MNLKHEFYKLPLRFDIERLKDEISGYDESDWIAHPDKFKGNLSIPLISVNGEINDDFAGPMGMTEYLKKSPYIQQTIASFKSVFSRSRLMRLDGQHEVPLHCDSNYHWNTRVRIHVPIITTPDVIFHCGDQKVHMAAGEAWIFNAWKMHKVVNSSNDTRVHLVIDTAGSPEFWKLTEKAEVVSSNPGDTVPIEPEFIQFNKDFDEQILTEYYNAPIVMPPGEVDSLSDEIMQDARSVLTNKKDQLEQYADILNHFKISWRSIWSIHGPDKSGWEGYEGLIANIKHHLSIVPPLWLSNTANVSTVLTNRILACALNSDIESLYKKDARSREGSNQSIPNSIGQAAKSDESLFAETRKIMFNKPIFIVAAPRSGSTMLFELLKQNNDIWTTGDETHHEFESIPELNITNRNYDSNGLTSSDATPDVSEKLLSAFLSKFRDAQGGTELYALRFLEKTPKNSLRIPFLRKIFPDALFIHLYREPRQNISSIMEAWNSGKFVTYADLPGWDGLPWSLLLPEGWRSLNNRSLEEIAAYQWEKSNLTIMDNLADLPDSQRCLVRYEDLINDKEGELKRVCEFMGIPFGPKMQVLCKSGTPLSRYTLSKPDPDKWKRNMSEIEKVLPDVKYIEDRIV